MCVREWDDPSTFLLTRFSRLFWRRWMVNARVFPEGAFSDRSHCRIRCHTRPMTSILGRRHLQKLVAPQAGWVESPLLRGVPEHRRLLSTSSVQSDPTICENDAGIWHPKSAASAIRDSDVVRLHRRFASLLATFAMRQARSDAAPTHVAARIRLHQQCAICGRSGGSARLLDVSRRITHPNLQRGGNITCAHILKSVADAQAAGIDFASVGNFLPLCGTMLETPSCHSGFDYCCVALWPLTSVVGGIRQPTGTYWLLTSRAYGYLRPSGPLDLPWPAPTALLCHAAYCVLNNRVLIPRTIRLDSPPGPPVDFRDIVTETLDWYDGELRRNEELPFT